MKNFLHNELSLTCAPISSSDMEINMTELKQGWKKINLSWENWE
jgi:hypothetical protein